MSKNPGARFDANGAHLGQSDREALHKGRQAAHVARKTGAGGTVNHLFPGQRGWGHPFSRQQVSDKISVVVVQLKTFMHDAIQLIRHGTWGGKCGGRDAKKIDDHHKHLGAGGQL